MTKTTTVASKAFVAVVAAAMVFSLVAPAAKAATAEELQAQIAALMAQITALQGGSTTTTTTTTSSTGMYTFTRALTMGSTGADVTALQNFLISKGHTIAAGATGYFGAQTAAAVAAWQSANGVSPAAGYFGPVSQAKYAAMMAVTTPTTPGTGTGTSTDDGDDTDSSDLSGEASLEDFTIDDADDTDVSEGAEEAEVGMVTVKFQDGDASISRLDLAFTDSQGTDSDAWDTFETISLWVDGDMVAEADASSKDDYLGDEDNGIIRFSGLDIVAMEDEDLEITVGATLQDNLDSENLGEWTMTGDSLRFFDADGVATTESTSIVTGESSKFNIEVAGINEELKFSLGTGNPDSTDIVVDETSSTNGITVLEYTIEAEDGDITLNDLSVTLVTSDDIDDVVSDIEIEIDGTTYSDDSRTLTPTTTSTYTFDIDGDVTIDDGDEVTVKVMVDFKRQTGNYSNGTTIKAEVTSTEVDATDAEGEDDLGASQLTGTAVGDVHNLVATGILIPVDGVTVSADTTGDNDQTGEFSIEFEVTAVEGDFYITDNVFASTSATNGVAFQVEGGSATSTGVLASTADEETDGVYTVRDGETETFTLTVTVDAAATAQYRVTLDEVNYSTNSDGVSAVMAAYLPTPASDFRTAYKNINAN